MKNVHILPTDKSSRIRIGDNGNFVIGLTQNSIRSRNDSFTNQHIYITSDEEIKEGDWFYDLDTKYVKIKQSWENSHLEFNGKKIILTTDQDLIQDGVQAIDDEFLEWFVQNPSCQYGGYKDIDWDKIIIPKEEPKQEWTPTQGEQVWIKVFSNWSSGTYIGYDTTKHIHLVRENEEGGGNLLSSSKILPYKSMPNEPKQETLEEAAARHFNKEDLVEGVNIQYVLQCAFIQGAKWMQESCCSLEKGI